MEKPIKCRKCGGLPYVFKVDDCYYAKCEGCSKWHPYEFLGVTPDAAIRNWNDGNTPNGSRDKRK